MKCKIENLRSAFLMKIMLMVSVILLGFASCTPESFVKPRLMKDESDAGHGAWRKAVIKIREGHVHGKVFHGHPMPESYEGVNYMKTYQEIKLELVTDEDGKSMLKSSYEGPIRFEPKTWYAMEILYYDKYDSLMNTKFSSDYEIARYHQHFMIPTKGVDIETGEPISDEELKDALSYDYRDTDPADYVRKEESDTTSLRSINDPMGFKGYFYEARGGIEYKLQLRFVHIARGDKRNASGRSYPFNDPATRMMGNFDMSYDIPIHVYTKFGMDGFFDDEIIIKDVAREFNIPIKTAKKEVKAKFYGGVDKHSSDYYL